MEFTQLYGDVHNDIDIDEDDDNNVLISRDNFTFIDNSEQINGNNVHFYRGYEDATKDLNEPTNDHEFWLNKRDLQHENYLSHDKDRNDTEFNQFDNLEARHKKFMSKMLIYQKGSRDSFYNVVLYALVFKMSKKFDSVTNEGKIEGVIGIDTYKKFKNRYRRLKT